MKKTIFVFLLIALALLSLAASVKSIHIHAPELMGGQMYYIVVGNRALGYTQAWGTWVFYGKFDGKEANCYLRKLEFPGMDNSGIGDYGDPIQCFMRFRDNKFSGWINFRGHIRAFCGADTARHLPARCKGE